LNAARERFAWTRIMMAKPPRIYVLIIMSEVHQELVVIFPLVILAKQMFLQQDPVVNHRLPIEYSPKARASAAILTELICAICQPRKPIPHRYAMEMGAIAKPMLLQ
jgi:hypothetical protein